MDHLRIARGMLGLCLILPLLGSAQTATRLYERALAANCAGCHGTEGRVAAGSSIPPLAGMPRDYMLLQMSDFRTGIRPATVMQQLAQGYTEDQVASLANYFSLLKRLEE